MENLMLKKFETDSGNPYWLLFEKGNISKPIYVFQEFQMQEFKYHVLKQTPEVKSYLGHKLTLED